jgi:hypothetical protein
MTMPFPLPIDEEFRIEVIKVWLDDVEDRLALGKNEDADLSFRIALNLYLKLPGNFFDQNLEDRIIAAQGKINQTREH